jgi:16S rRNA (guanine1207-N2)-methyltransferase
VTAPRRGGRGAGPGVGAAGGRNGGSAAIGDTNGGRGVEHYFSRAPGAESRPGLVEYALPGAADGILRFFTDSGVFSRERVDYGTDLLIRSLPVLRGRVLDLGCGYGALGIAAARLSPEADVYFVDVNERAVALCRENLLRNRAEGDVGDLDAATDATGGVLRSGERVFCSDGFSGLGGAVFDTIITNPPIRTGKANLFRLYRECRAHLAEDGALYLVIQRKQGLESTFAELLRVFGNCADVARRGGFHVLRAGASGK